MQRFGAQERGMTPCQDFFDQLIRRMKLIDIPLVKLCATWRNKWVGEDRVEKRLDHFLVSKALMEACPQIRKWVGTGGVSDHSPILMEIATGPRKPPSPFKFNSEWLKEESFISLVKDHWMPFDANVGAQAGVQFVENIQRIKQATIAWARAKKQRDMQDLIDIEATLQVIYDSEGGGFVSTTSKEELRELEGRRRKLLEEREAEWRLKSRAIWLEKGDENTKFFQAFAKGRKMANTIWSLNDQHEERFLLLKVWLD
jgi:hypothetical protein